MSIKHILRKTYNEYVRKQSAHNFRNEMSKKFLLINSQISPLSKEEISDIKKHWNQYGYQPDLNAFRWFYHVSGKRDWRFITEEFYACHIMPKLYDVGKAKAFDDKNLYDLYFNDVLMPETIIHNVNGVFLDNNYKIVPMVEVINRVKKIDGEVVIKPAIDSCKGQNVRLINSREIENYLDSYDKNYIIQKRVNQHPTFVALNESSSNVVRITSMLVNGRVYSFSPTIRVGDAGRFIDQGGTREFCIGIDSSGRFKENGLATKSSITPESVMPNGYKFGGVELPGFAEMKVLANKLHPRLASFPIIGWDFITDTDGNVNLIECNLHWAGIVKYQECNGPLFGEYTEEILNSIFGK